MTSELQEYTGNEVVIDTKSTYIYLGTLTEEGAEYIVLSDVDVHDHTESTISKELYIIEALKYGIKVNRKRAKVLKRDIISISMLEDVVKY